MLSYINHLSEFNQIYSIDAVEDKDELIIVGGQRVKGQGHSETT